MSAYRTDPQPLTTRHDRGRWRRPVGLGLAVALVATLPTASAVAAPPPGVGAPGIGDAYFPLYGNGGYDVDRYDVGVRYLPATGEVRGDSVVVAEATQRLRRFNLDLVLDAEKVWVDGVRAEFAQGERELRVTPATPIAAGERMRVRVTYAGRPTSISVDGVRPFIPTPTGALAIGQPEIAAWWFPSNDHPSDRAGFRIDLTVPKGLQAISNGRLAGRRTRDGLTTWRWRGAGEMATYLPFAAFGRYAIDRGRGLGRPALYAYEKGMSAGLLRRARATLRQTPAVTRMLQSAFGSYPFDQLGGVVTRGSLGYALENQTRPVYDQGFFVGSPRSSSGIVAHEMAHQWFGDSLSLGRWRDIWLNEGYATYAEWLWDAHRGGASLRESYERAWGSYGAGSRFWTVQVGDPGPGRIFAGPVYYRGAMTLFKLRERIGAADFATLTRRWFRENRGSAVTTPQFVALAEDVSGTDLGGFFRTWLYAERRPAR